MQYFLRPRQIAQLDRRGDNLALADDGAVTFQLQHGVVLPVDEIGQLGFADKVR